jgi:mono/diheme cytochrome c family protein
VICAYAWPKTSAASSRQWKAPAAEAERKNPLAAESRSVSAGKTTYAHDCQSCHGQAGKGDGKEGMDLSPRPADLSSRDVLGQTDGELFWKITTGRKPMPSFRKSLTDEQRWELVNFMRTLSAPAAKGANP